MKRSRYSTGLILAALLLSLLLAAAGCSGNGGSSSPAPASPSAEATATTVKTAAPLGSIIPEESRISAPVMGHSAEKFYDCLKCHNPGRIEKAPDDHAGYTNQDCQKCHIMED